MIQRHAHKGLLTLLILLAVGGCGGEDATGPGQIPTANPDFMVGDWLATSLLDHRTYSRTDVVEL